VFIEKLYESLFIEIQTSNGKKAIIGSIYRPNTKYSNLTLTEQFNQFNDLLISTLSTINPSCETFLLGDINLDALKYNLSTHVTTYIDSLFACGFLQTITKPTRCTEHSATLIDHAITNSLQSEFNIAILTKRISDHFPIVVLSGLCLPKAKKATITLRDFSELNITNFKTTLAGFGWAGITEDDNPETSYDAFHAIFTDLYNTFFQPKSTRFNKKFHKQEKWMTKGLLISRLTKLSLEKQHAKNPSGLTWDKFKIYPNVYNSTVRACKKLYYATELETNANNLKKTWSILNDVLKKTKAKQPINSVFCNGSLLTDPKLIANAFNEFFTTIADKIANLINPILSSHLPGEDSPTPNVENEIPHLFNMSEIPITIEEITTCINSLEGKKNI
jgi:hypothetical protein